MLPLADLMTDVDGSVGRGSGADRARTLHRITDLFVGRAEVFGAAEIELFDAVIQRFTRVIETRARVELAERLAPLASAPPGVVALLARDEIVVARPVLSRSPRLDDQTLMAIAHDQGRDHMLAICERPSISPCVTDVLVTAGDGVVRHAVVGNPGARFSPVGTATLIHHARSDQALGELLGERSDLSPFEARQLVEIAKEAARLRLLAALPGAEREIASAVERGASSIAAPLAGRRRAAFDGTYGALSDDAQPTEADLARFAGDGRVTATITALSSLTHLSISCLERIFDERDNDLLIVIGKARGWSWRTVRALLRLRDPSLSERHHFRRAEETFDGLASATAARVLHFLKVRETADHARAQARADRGHTRVNVR